MNQKELQTQFMWQLIHYMNARRDLITHLFDTTKLGSEMFRRKKFHFFSSFTHEANKQTGFA